jgi:hypothetical protein
MYGNCPFCKQQLSTSFVPILRQKEESSKVILDNGLQSGDDDESMDLEMLI